MEARSLKSQLEQLLQQAVNGLVGGLLPTAPDASQISVERTRDTQHGDFASNVAMRLAKAARRNPRELAQAIAAALPANALIERTEVAGAGFINFYLAAGAYGTEVARVFELGAAYGQSSRGRNQSIIIEFVSANPTGPLHVAHGRHAAYGATLANLLRAAGHRVHREFYVNDAGRQMDILAVSLWLRYLELSGEAVAFPAGGYQGAYLKDIAAELRDSVGAGLVRAAAAVVAGLPADEAEGGDKDGYVDALIARARELLGESAFQEVLGRARDRLLGNMRTDLEDFGVVYDRWYSEMSLATSGALDRALARLRQQGHLYQKDGATWFRASEFGDEKDRVVVRENGLTTYFASDIAYHLDKRERGFDLLIDVLGSGHHGYVARVRGGLAAMGEPPDSLEVPMIQVVTLFRGGEQLQMSKRSGQFVTLRELRAEVGNDACRFFFLMRGHEQPLDFDLDLATARTNENPVYYVQYAHARASSVMKQLQARGLTFERAEGLANVKLLTGELEQVLLNRIAAFTEIIETAAANRTPQTLVFYLRELANGFHSYYNSERFIVAESPLRNARLALVGAAQQVIRNGLTLLGVSAPESM
ncbi:MAG TPA: arginine--tRNA ligase [Steroidobacteraceae bacterium]|nr:arginine--tRNA ligase [Steroidobacteraceae bacterium]